MKIKIQLPIVIVLMVGLLALVQPAGAAQAAMNGNNWTNINYIWDSLGMSYLKNSSLLQGGNVTLTKYANGSVLIASTGGSVCTDCPNSTVAANLANWNSTYNLSYAKGGLPFSINNGTNVIETNYNDSFTTVYAGTITKLIAHSSQTGSINVSFWNATAGNTYIDSVLITAGTDGNKTLSYAFSDETRIMFNVTSVADIKKVALTVKTTKN